MARWNRGDAESSCPRHATGDARTDDKGRGGGERRCSRTDTAVDECRYEMGRVARYRCDYQVEPERLRTAPESRQFLFVFVDLFTEGGTRQLSSDT